MGKVYDLLRYHIVPTVFVPFFTCGSLVLVLIGSAQPVSLQVILSRCVGNAFSWSVVGIMLVWAWLSLIVPGPVTHGPPFPNGTVPVYKNNGFLYYLVTVLAFICLLMARPDFSDELARAHVEVVGSLNIVALTLCLYLLIIGKHRIRYSPQEPRRPLIFEFYRGMEYSPRILGVDVKQLTNCRIGVMAWQLLVISFFVCSTRRHGHHVALVVAFALQTLYLAKFFWWEQGYFNTLDLTLDRAGYYICWGCLVLLPSLYTATSLYLTSYPPSSPPAVSWAALLLGVMAIALNYRVDYEKHIFRSEPNQKHVLLGRPVKFVEAEYVDSRGQKATSRLLLSGMWGLARHLNYTFEIMAALTWSVPAWGLGVFPFIYPIFLTLLLFQRLYRDEEKCRTKYGKSWTTYCEKVPYRLIPRIF